MKSTYRAAVPLNGPACDTALMSPWLPTQLSLELFGGYLRMSAAFAAPGVY